MAELEVGEERERVHGADPAVDLEEQVGDGFAGQHVADHELRDDVVPGLLQGFHGTYIGRTARGQ